MDLLYWYRNITVFSRDGDNRVGTILTDINEEGYYAGGGDNVYDNYRALSVDIYWIRGAFLQTVDRS